MLIRAPGQDPPTDSSPSAQAIPPWLALVLSIAFTCAAIYFTFARAPNEPVDAALPMTPGVITASQLREFHQGSQRMPDEIVGYTLDITYDYIVDGQSFEGHRITYTDNVWDLESAEALAKKYAVGTTHAVSYNPATPESCLLEPGVAKVAVPPSEHIFLSVLTPIGLFLVGMVFLGQYFCGRRIAEVSVP